MTDGVRAMWMRGGTSKGGFFLAEDLPADPVLRDAFLLGMMGSPDVRQIDGMGGGDPVTSKVAVISRSDRPGVDIDYLFLQIFVKEAIVADQQNCGNMLAAAGPFAIERGLVSANVGETRVAIHMINTGQQAVATVRTPGGRVAYAGDMRIDGVPGAAAPVDLFFKDTAGSSCGALLPTGNVVDDVAGAHVTLIDNGMPCVIVRADAVGIAGSETRDELEADDTFRKRIETIRLAAGPLMKLGDVSALSIPKMIVVSPPLSGGTITTRCLIPHRVHASIGVLAAITVSTACLLPGSVAAQVAATGGGRRQTLGIEHPTGAAHCVIELDDSGRVTGAGMRRTARKLFDGMVFAPAARQSEVTD